MATGKSTQLARQIGEHLVVSMLGRKGVIATPFAGSVPDIDILASDVDGSVHPIQVKTINGPMWQFSASKFLEIKFDKKLKTQKDIKRLDCNDGTKNIIFVLVKLGSKKDPIDRFFVLKMEEIQDLIKNTYNGENRPNNWESTHCAISPKQLEKYEGWCRIGQFMSVSSEE